MIEGHERQIGRFAWVMAWVGLMVGQLHALARFRTADGLEDIDPDNYPLTAAWAVPADDLFSPQVGWADPDIVYLTYGKVWVPVFVAFTLAAVVVYRRRRPRGIEKWVWLPNLALFAVLTLGIVLTYGVQFRDNFEGDGIMAAVFTVGTYIDFLGLGLMLITSTGLGLTLLLKRFRPVLPAVLLMASIPVAIVVMEVTSLGSVSLPVAFAFGILGRRIAKAEADVAATRDVVPA